MFCFILPSRIIVVLLCGFCSILVSGCASSASCNNATTAAQAPLPLLLFQKTPCYGFCPAYDAQIYEDGSMTYTGYKNAPVEDTLQLCLPKHNLEQINKALVNLNYTSLQDAYRSQRTDQASTYLTFYQNGRQTKRIRHQEGGPPELLQFQEMVEQFVLKQVANHRSKPQ